MDPIDYEFTAPATLPNFAKLRDRVLDKWWLQPTAVFTEEENQGFSAFFVDECVEYRNGPDYDGAVSALTGQRDYRANRGLCILERDYETCPDIPKWAMLHSWLAPESAASSCPGTITKITHLMLSNQLKDYKQRHRP